MRNFFEVDTTAIERRSPKTTIRRGQELEPGLAKGRRYLALMVGIAKK